MLPPAFADQVDPESPNADDDARDDLRDELDEHRERDIFDSPSDSWVELEDLERLMELEEEPTGRHH